MSWMLAGVPFGLAPWGLASVAADLSLLSGLRVLPHRTVLIVTAATWLVAIFGVERLPGRTMEDLVRLGATLTFPSVAVTLGLRFLLLDLRTVFQRVATLLVAPRVSSIV